MHDDEQLQLNRIFFAGEEDRVVGVAERAYSAIGSLRDIAATVTSASYGCNSLPSTRV
jgi:hypothetical protein